MLLSVFLIVLICIYISKIRRPLLLTSNAQLKQITLKFIFPILILNSGVMQSAIQHLFYCYIIYGAKKTIINLTVEPGVVVVVEKYEKKKRGAKMSKFLKYVYQAIRKFNRGILWVVRWIQFIIMYMWECVTYVFVRKITIPKSPEPEHRTITEITRPVDNVILVHGLNGSADSKYMIQAVNLFLKKGCRVFCLNSRGEKGGYKGYKFSYFGQTDDIRTLTKHILNTYTGDIFYVGFSQGGNNVTKFAGEFDHVRIKGGVGVCNPFNFEKVVELADTGTFVQRLAQIAILTGFKEYLHRVTGEEFEEDNFVKLLQTLINRGTLPDKSVGDFYERSSSEYSIPKLRKPWLFINADDDPIVPVEIIPKEEIFSNENTGLVTMQGGHLGFKSIFLTSTIDDIIDEFYEIL